MNNQTIFWVWLQQALGYASNDLKKIVSKYSFAEDYYSEDEDVRLAAADFKNSVKLRLADTSLSRAQAIIRSCEKCGIQIIAYGDEAYPTLLKDIEDPPAVLYVKGQAAVLKTPLCIGMVGTRKAGPAGSEMAYELASDLAAVGVCVVSGGAVGIDIQAHKGALRSNGTTVCVLGCGHEAAYLKSHDCIKQLIAENGAVVSEYPPDLHPTKYTFPIRNRIISGLSSGVVVVEAGEKSGSLITVDYAIKQGRDVFAVPGAFDNPYAKGTNRLIKEGAAAVSSAHDILDAYGGAEEIRRKKDDGSSKRHTSAKESHRGRSGVPDKREQRIWKYDNDAHDPLYVMPCEKAAEPTGYGEEPSHCVTRFSNQRTSEYEAIQELQKAANYVIIDGIAGKIKLRDLTKTGYDSTSLRFDEAPDWIVQLAKNLEYDLGADAFMFDKDDDDTAVETCVYSYDSDNADEVKIYRVTGDDWQAELKNMKNAERFAARKSPMPKTNKTKKKTEQIKSENNIKSEVTNVVGDRQKNPKRSPKQAKATLANNNKKQEAFDGADVINVKRSDDGIIDELSENAGKVLEELGSETLHIDTIAMRCGLPIYLVHAAATELELGNLIEALDGRYYKRIK